MKKYIFIILIPLLIFFLVLVIDVYRNKKKKDLLTNNPLLSVIEGFKNNGNHCVKSSGDIHIVFHKFRFSEKYIIDKDTILQDYTNQEFLQKNFVNILNNIWSTTGTTFNLLDIIKENEIDNLKRYYTYTPNSIYADTNDGCSMTQSSITQSTELNSVDDTQHTVWANLDLAIVNKILNKDDIFMLSSNNSFEEHKRTLQSIFPKMLDNTEYINNKLQIHICLVPFIRSTNTILIKGEDGIPLIVFSMYRYENGKYIPNIDNIHSEKTSGIWLPSYINREKQLNDVNTDIKELLNGNETELNTNQELYDTTIQELKRIKNRYPNLDKYEKDIECLSNKVKNLYEIDYNEHEEIKKLSNYKGKSNYYIVVKEKIEELLRKDKDKIDEYNQEIKTKQIYVSNYNNESKDIIKNKNETLDKLDSLYSNGENTEQIKKLVKIKQNLKKEINFIKHHIKKMNSMLEFNTILCLLFGISISDSKINKISDNSISKKYDVLKSVDNDQQNNLIIGSLIENKDTIILESQKKIIGNKYPRIKNIDDIYSDNSVNSNNSNNSYNIVLNNPVNGVNKCSLLDRNFLKINEYSINNPQEECSNSIPYETTILEKIDLGEQIHILDELIKLKENGGRTDNDFYLDGLDNLDLKYLKDLKNTIKKNKNCPGAEKTIHTERRVEKEYLQDTFFTYNEAVANLNEIIKTLEENKNLDEIFNETNLETIKQELETHAENNPTGRIFANEKSFIFPEQGVEPQKTDAIYCPSVKDISDIKDYSLLFQNAKNDTKSLNDYILNKPICGDTYMDTFSESYI